MKLILTRPKQIKLAVQMDSLACSLADLDNVFRPYRKYRELTDEQYTIYEEIQTAVYELLGDHVTTCQEYVNELDEED